MGWIGYDLDGSLAEWGTPDCPMDVLTIGKPIAASVERVTRWIAEGKDVRIFTARVGPASAAECFAEVKRLTQEQIADLYDGGPFDRSASTIWYAYQRQLIERWCLQHLGTILPITATKDFHMWQLWDDRCVQLHPNTGEPFDRLAGR